MNRRIYVLLIYCILLPTFLSGQQDSKKLNISFSIDSFTFTSNEKELKGKIFLPVSCKINNDLPAIYLIDFAEQHFKIATDEFEKVIDAVRSINDLNTLVISLEGIPEIDAKPDTFKEHFGIYKDMTHYVDSVYTKNTSRTFIGKGSEAGIVLMALLIDHPEENIFDNFIATDPSGEYASVIIKMLEKDDFPLNKKNKKLHFSFSTSNDAEKCNKIIHLIEKAQYPWLKFSSVEYTESNYENTYPVSFKEGIDFIFKN